MKTSNPKLIQLIQILNDGQSHSGEELGQKLNMTRSAVWKYITQLETRHVQFEKHRKQGYRLITPLVLLDQQKILNAIDHTFRSQIDLHLFEEITSTIDFLKSNQTNCANKIPICLAETQTQGRGRLARVWYSPFGQNIYYSLLYRFELDISELAGLSLVVSLVIAKTLREYNIPDIKIKWPNDILFQTKKLAGVLIEVFGETHGHCHVIISFGLNVNMQHVPDPSLSGHWTSLYNILHQVQDRNILIGHITSKLLKNLNQFEQTGFSKYHKLWEQYDYLNQKTIQITHLDHCITGRALGINEQGHLRLQHKEGEIRTYSAGETSIYKFQ